MNKFLHFLLAVLLAAMLFTPAYAAQFSIAFYEQTGDINDDNGHNFFTDYTLAGGGGFEILDDAVTPNNLVMFSAEEFLSFTSSFTALSTGDSSTFVLGTDDFEENDPNERGLLFDAAGDPLRFDRLGSTASGNRSMCTPICEIAVGSRATVSLIDLDSFEAIYLNDGSVTTISNNVSGDPYTRFTGNWTYQKGTTVGGSGIQVGGFYTVTAIPVPAAAWLFGSALLVLGAIKRRQP